MIYVYLVSVVAVGGLSFFVGYLLGKDDLDGQAATPATKEVIEVATDKEVDIRVDGAQPLDSDVAWLRRWSGPKPRGDGRGSTE